MRVRQYAYFSIKSDEVSLPDITARLGTEPDEVRRKGSRRAGPLPMPRCNIWQLNSGLPRTVPLNDHFEALAAKLLPLTEPIRTFLDSSDAYGYLVVCRVFTTGPEDDEVLAPYEGPPGAERIPGQHPLLGFDLSDDLLHFLAYTATSVDFDEYGDEYDRP